MSKAMKWRKPAVWLAPLFLVVTFTLGGGARADITSLVFLRPLAALFLGVGILNLRRDDIERHRMLFGCLVAVGVLALVQLIPLPPALWHQLPGHQIVRDIDAALGLGGVWRPISLAPNGTLNALLSLLVPAALLVHVAKLDTAGVRRLVVILIFLGLFSAIIGIAQAVGPRGGGLYFYRITNQSFAVGLFANRNHQAVVLACLFPMLAAFASFPAKLASNAKMRLVLVLLAGVALIPLLLITGSRLGVGLGALGILAARWVYRAPDTPSVKRRESKPRNYTPLIVATAVIGLVVITALLAQVSVFGRFTDASDALTDIRFRVWQPIMEATWVFFPFGSGLGSFAEVYRIYEPTELLRATYLNHAHNDLLEVCLTAGVAGLAIICVASASLARSLVRTARSRYVDSEISPLNRMGAAVVVMLAIGSLVDYPLRTPSIACIFILAAVCLRHDRTTDR
ncbi:MAG: O-antigen ligase family protein [Sphingosinicella sp.]|nr:O-antigen ligase family protein [Sphingosinicella sp.]